MHSKANICKFVPTFRLTFIFTSLPTYFTWNSFKLDPELEPDRKFIELIY